MKDWEKRVGIDVLANKLEEVRVDLHAAQEAFGTVRLETVADAVAILRLVRRNLRQFGELDHWEKTALNNASKFFDQTTAGDGRRR